MSAAGDRVTQAIVGELADPHVRPGDRLSGAPALAARLGIAVEAAVAALRRLDDRGVVDLQPDGRVLARPEPQWDVLDAGVLRALLTSPHGARVLAEYLEYRRLVEVVAAGLAAEHATTRDLAALSDRFAEMTDAADHALTSVEAEARFHAADVAFHQALIAAARNRPLELATDALRPALCTARQVLARPHLREERALPEHRRILAAVAQGDPDAARAAMAAHLDTVETYLREYAGLSGCAPESSGRPDAP
jgi:GntR family transcriptional repressor for pyruvate dehydrogenase complex